MLDLIRKKQKSLLIKIVFWVIIATFVGTIFLVWGRGRGGPGGEGEVAVRVNRQRVTFGEFRGAYENLRRLYQNIYRDQFTPEMEDQLGLAGQVLEGLINQALLLQEADRQRIRLSRDELVESIARIPAFQVDGVFNKEQYLRVLAYERLTPEQFEEGQRRQLLLEKIRQQMEAGAAVDEEQIVDEYRLRHEQVNLAYVRFAPALFENAVEVTEEALQVYYREHADQFRLPETIALDYLEFRPADYEQSVDLGDEALQTYYRRNLARFDVAEQVQVAHILIRVDEDADERLRAQKRQLADQLLEQLRARDGENFAELARRYSDDAGSAVRGGTLDYFVRGTMVPDFEDAAFALRPGQLSMVVKTRFGYHILRGMGYIEAGVKDLADVIDEVRAGVLRERSRQIAMQKATDAYNIHHRGADLETAAETAGLTLRSTGPFERGSTVPGIGSAPELNEAAFRLGEGEMGRPVALAEAIYLVRVAERTPSRVPDLDRVRSAVEAAYRRQQARLLARQAAEALLAEVGSGTALEAVVRGMPQEVEQTGFFSRSYGNFVPRIGNAAAVAAAAFELSEEQPVADRVFQVGDRYLVVVLKQRQPADMAALDEEKKTELKNLLLARARENLLETKLQELRGRADIKIHPALQHSLKEDMIR